MWRNIKKKNIIFYFGSVIFAWSIIAIRLRRQPERWFRGSALIFKSTIMWSKVHVYWTFYNKPQTWPANQIRPGFKKRQNLPFLGYLRLWAQLCRVIPIRMSVRLRLVTPYKAAAALQRKYRPWGARVEMSCMAEKYQLWKRRRKQSFCLSWRQHGPRAN